MNKCKINIGNKEYFVEIAESEQEQKKGLQDRDFLAIDEGMLFVYPKEQECVKYWMKDTNIPLDMIAINDDDEVTMVYQALPKDETLIPFTNVKYILEVNQNSGINIGDDFEIDEDDDINKYVMKVIASDGSTQFFLQGGERIVSRRETRVLIKKAKKAELLKNDEAKFNSACKSLGKYMFKVLLGLDGRKPEYVSVPEGNKKDK